VILTLKEIADKTGAEIVGDPEKTITGVSSFEDADSGELTFASDPKFLKRMDQTRAGAIFVPPEVVVPESGGPDLLIIDNPRLHFFRILALFHPLQGPMPGISPKATLGEGVRVGRDVAIFPGVFVGDGTLIGDGVSLMPGTYLGQNTVIGNGTMIKPNVTIMENSRIGKRVIIHSGTVIGSDGFGFTQDISRHEKIPHAGFVQIDDDVEIGAGNTIDRGTFGRTWIKEGVKTDNLVHIAHNVVVGRHTLLVAQVGIAGSSSLGDNVIVAGKAGISGHLKVGDNAIVGPGAGVLHDVPPGKIVSGMPQMDHKIWLKVGNIIPRLPEMRKKLLALEKKFERFRKN